MSGNTSYGDNSLQSITTGEWNTAIGAYSATHTTTGISNTSLGTNSLLNNNGSYNTALGTAALLKNEDGDRNVSIGSNVMEANVHGNDNIAIGAEALYTNVSGSQNTAIGTKSLYNLYNADDNVAIGNNSGLNNIEGSHNTFIGSFADVSGSDTYEYSTAIGYGATFNTSNLIVLGTTTETVFIPGLNLSIGEQYYDKSTADINISTNEVFLHVLGNAYIAYTDVGVGSRSGNSTLTLEETWNTAVGASALYNQTTGNYNQAFGDRALENLIDGSCNTAIGYKSFYSLVDGSLNTAIGFKSGLTDVSGCCNTYLGSNTNVDGNDIYNNSTAIGYGAIIDASNLIVIGTELETSIIPGFGLVIGKRSTNYCNDDTFVPRVSLDVSGNALINTVEVGTGGGWGNNTLAPYENCNTALGKQALAEQSTGNNNTAIGYETLYYLYDGNFNTALGYMAGFNESGGENNTYVGATADTDGNDDYTNSTAIGYGAIIDASNLIVLGTNTETVYAPGKNLSIGGKYSDFEKTIIDISTNDVYLYSLGNALIAGNDFGVGSRSGNNTLLFENNWNLAVGYQVLYNQTDGNYNIAFGDLALYDLTNGSQNTAVGYESLTYIDNGNYNTAIGYNSGMHDVSGNNNTYVGATTDTDDNDVYENSTALGYGAIIDASNLIVLGTSTETVYAPGKNLSVGGKYSDFVEASIDISTNDVYLYSLGNALIAGNDFGVGSRSGNNTLSFENNWNLAAGFNALYSQTNGNHNQAFGDRTLINLTDGSCNTAVGYKSLFSVVDGNFNTAIGFKSGLIDISGCCNTYLGANTDIDASSNIYNNSTAIGYGSKIDESNQIVLGTSTESVYFRGGLNYSVGALTEDTILSFPLLQFYTLELNVTGVILGLPTPINNGSYTSFKNMTLGNITIAAASIYPKGLPTSAINITLASGEYTSFIAFDGSWYQY